MLKYTVFAALGCICLAIGCIGIVLPILPTVPFFLLTIFFFANSSKKLHDKFVGSKLYKNHLESFVQKRGMTVKTKSAIIISVTVVMGIGFFLMMRAQVVVPSIILAVVWVCHLIYFGFFVKTIKRSRKTENY